MSVESPAAPHPGPDAAARRRTSISLLVAVGLLGIVLWLILSGYLVRLDNDHNNHSVLPGAVPAGGAAAGDLTLSNTGWLPIQVTLQPRLADGTAPSSIPATLTISIQDVTDGQTVYSGQMRGSMGPLLVLQPGQAARLHIEVRSTEAGATGPVPLAYTYYWNARPAMPWWWWIPVVVLVALVEAGGYWRPGRTRVTP